jgi:hypothetical protein
MSEAQHGWIDSVENDAALLCLYVGESDGEPFCGTVPLMQFLECQRQYVEPGATFKMVNGHFLMDKELWSSFDIEEADREAEALHAALHR